MPGVTVLRARDDRLPAGAVEAALDAAGTDDDRVTRVVDRDRLFVAAAAHPAYPVETVETDAGPVVLDGALYDAPAGERPALLRAAGRALRAGDDDRLRSWLRARDGEFVVVAADGADAHVALDRFGRLPCYRAVVGGCEVLAREPRVVRAVARAVGAPLELDRLSAAQALLFGYRLGRRTPFAGVKRLPPAGRVTTGGDPTRLDRFPVASDPADASTARIAARLADRFVDACRRRAERGPGERVVVSLSGGLDSRAVLGGVVRGGVDARAITFDRTDAETGDVAEARATAAALGVPWTRHETAASDAAERRLFRWTQGTNSLAMAFLLPFLDAVAADGPTTMLTGDGGDKVMPALAPVPVGSVPELLAHVLDAEGRVDPADAAATAGVSPRRLVRSVRDRLTGYPDDRPTDRYVRFYLRERATNWLVPGEDRNRRRVWSTTPFYAPGVYGPAMACPDDRKRGSGLYRRFLDALDGRLTRVDYADFGAPPASVEYRLKRRGYEALAGRPRLRRLVVDAVTGGGGVDAALADRAARRLDEAPGLDAGAARAAAAAGRGSAAVWYDALTVAATASALADD